MSLQGGLWSFLLIMISVVVLLMTAFGTDEPFAKTNEELSEDDPEWIDCNPLTGADCVPADLFRDIGDLITMKGVPVDPFVRTILIAVVWVPFLLGLLGVFASLLP